MQSPFKVIESGKRYIVYMDLDLKRECIRCLRCHHLSYNPHDVKERYCGYCHEHMGEEE